VDARLGGGQLSVALELGDQGVVVGQLYQLLAAQAVGARVADVRDRDHAVVDERRG